MIVLTENQSRKQQNIISKLDATTNAVEDVFNEMKILKQSIGELRRKYEADQRRNEEFSTTRHGHARNYGTENRLIVLTFLTKSTQQFHCY